jgi:secondary thiamine-phosphate synthase enzyme
MQSQISIRTRAKTELINITSQVSKALASSGIEEGLCTVYIPHTTAGITINEAADPTVARDILMEINKIVPFEDGYRHMEGNSAAHLKSTLVGVSCQIPVSNGSLALGTWQGIFFCEFDGPRNRKATITVSTA